MGTTKKIRALQHIYRYFNGLIAIEQQNLAVEESRMRRVQLMLASDDRVTQQRAEQRQRQNAEALRATTSPIGGLQ